ncbi:MAG: FKBP-type peptidyl-prolyl cis-trans isomerase [Acidobacteriia bacterium]|nr:FKBP-type peptidyl-prolyl cis-trans isomerase [Terriglobia bacterium]
MKRIAIVVLGFGVWACGASAQDAPAALKTQKEKLSYAIGMEMGKGVKAQELDVDPELISRGLKDALSGGKPLMGDDELQTVIGALREEMKQKQMQAEEAAAEENRKQGEAFLAENGKKTGVVTTASGLQYKIITAGTGKKPVETDTVLCNYKGTFLDGTEFDSSAEAGKPVPFDIKTVIPGFKEALQLMPVGSKWQIVVPASLAYGERGAGNVIGPNATLIFEVELVSIQDAAAPAGAK